MAKKRILTGDRTTGKLHLGHYVGSLANRLRLQDEYECFLIIADLHMLTTKAKRDDILQVADDVRGIVLDYLGAGIDALILKRWPNKPPTICADSSALLERIRGWGTAHSQPLHHFDSERVLYLSF